MEDKYEYRQAIQAENDCWLSLEAQDLADEAEAFLKRAIEPTWRKVGRTVGRAIWNETSIKWLAGISTMMGAPPIPPETADGKSDGTNRSY